MKNLCAPEIAKFRDHNADEMCGTADDERHLGGAFLVPVPSPWPHGFNRTSYLRVIASAGCDQHDPRFRWDHVSVSLENRTPTWAEMDFIKRLFFKPEEVCIQLHVAARDHINNHAFCLHIWRPLDYEIPLPPPIMVGIEGLEAAS